MNHKRAFEAAKLWVELGFKVFPLHASSKVPFGGTNGHNNATTDLRLLEAAFNSPEVVGSNDVGFGVIPGSNGYIVFDVDEGVDSSGERKNGIAHFKRLQEEIGVLPIEAVATTPSGGYHVWFKKPVSIADEHVRNSKLGGYKDLDVRCDGGYVLAPGNPNREWQSPLENAKELPEEWVDLLRVGTQSSGQWSKIKWDELHPTDAEMLEYLIEEWGGHDPFILGNGSIGICRPGVSHNSGSIGNAGPGHFHVFSGAWAHPKDPSIALDVESNWNKEELIEYCLTKVAPHTSAAPVMDQQAFYGPLGEAVQLFEHTEADPAAVYLSLLTGFGNMIGDSPYVEPVSTVKQYTRLNTLIIGASAKARKSAAWGQARTVLEAIDEKYADQNVMGGFGSGHILVDHLADDANAKVEGDVETGMTITPDKRVMIFEDEFVRVLKTVNSDGSIYSAVLRSAFDGSKLEVRSRQKTSIVPRGKHHISMLGCITVEELQQTLTNTEAYNGFGNRLLYVFARKTKSVALSDVELDVARLSTIGRSLRSRVEVAKDRNRVFFATDAKELWTKMYEEMQEDDPDGMLGTIIARSDVLCLRLALILALADGSEAIERQHLEAAYSIWKYCRATAAYVFKKRANIEITGDKKHDDLSAKVYDYIYGQTHEGAGLTELKKPPVANRNNQDLVDGILQELIDADKIVMAVVSVPGKRGPKPTKYFAKLFAPREGN